MTQTLLIPKDLKSLSIIGLSKNAGKTTVFNALTGAYTNRYVLGIVSAGVDGEEHDVWSHRPKPRVDVPAGAVVATAGLYLDESPGDWELLHAVGIESAAGALFVAKARKRTTVKLVGVAGVSQLRRLLHLFCEAGVGLTLVDGAYDRKAAASPSVTSGTLLVVGASMDVSLERILLKLEELVHSFALPMTSFQQAAQGAMTARKVTIIQDEEMEQLPISSLFQIKAFFKLVHKQKIQCIATPGAVTDVMLRTLIEQKIAATIVIPDATHLFTSLPLLRQFYRQGGVIEVMSPIQLVGVAINPTSPEGYAFQSTVMKEKVRRICPQVPVFDVMREGIGCDT